MFIKLGKGEDLNVYLFGFVFLVILAFVLPYIIGDNQSNIKEVTLQEYKVCEYQGVSVYISGGRICNISDIKYVALSPDDKIHVVLEKRIAPKSIWYFYSLGEHLTVYVPLECK
jgi:hypothetical protein